MATRGEVAIARRESLDFKKSWDELQVMYAGIERSLPRRLSYSDASDYYRNKIRKEFERLGYKYKVKKSIVEPEPNFELALAMVLKDRNKMIRAEIKKLREYFI